ncbi:MAG: TIGR00341 family protein [bacterium]|nr:TIGR00341 family protein [bacterium]
MSVLVVITAESEAAALTRYGYWLARAHESDLSVLYVTWGTEEGEPLEVPLDVAGEDAVCELIRGAVDEMHESAGAKAAASAASAADVGAADESPDPSPPLALPTVRLHSLVHRRRRNAVMRRIKADKPSILLLGHHRRHKQDRADALLTLKLFEAAPCTTILLRPGDSDGRVVENVLVPADRNRNSEQALRVASRVVRCSHGRLYPFHVGADMGDLSEEVGSKVLDRIVRRAGLAEQEQVSTRVVLGDDVEEAIREEAAEGYDLVLLGSSDMRSIRRRLFKSVPDHLLSGPTSLAVAVVRGSRPLHDILTERFERLLHLKVPQLGRSGRIELFEELQTKSRWSFDFLTLICLSTALAALGLIQNSTAVVIGAMLVAPLMTPLLGCGLALVQGNLPLIRESTRSILYGYFSALAIGVLMGFLAPIEKLTPELLARGGPTLLDMGVGFLSGLAASYCLARPGLSSALAGVAIAAALVPPIATTGISIALGNFEVARGSSLLLGVNVVAIILGAAFSFYAAGIRGRRGASRSRALWARRTLLVLVLLVAILAIPLGSVLVSRALKSRARSVVSETFLNEVREFVAADSDVRLIGFRRLAEDGQTVIEIDVAATHDTSPTLADDLTEIARRSLDGPVMIRVFARTYVERSTRPDSRK